MSMAPPVPYSEAELTAALDDPSLIQNLSGSGDVRSQGLLRCRSVLSRGVELMLAEMLPKVHLSSLHSK